MNIKRIHEKTEWALTKDAKELVKTMESVGFDRDLAISVLEQCMGEEAVYELPDPPEAA